MTRHCTAEFDFDDWAGLYLENPQEFEARRKAALMIELSRGSERQRTASRAILDAYERQVSGGNSQERLQVAMRMMAESAKELCTELQMLKHTLEQSVTTETATGTSTDAIN